MFESLEERKISALFSLRLCLIFVSRFGRDVLLKVNECHAIIRFVTRLFLKVKVKELIKSHSLFGLLFLCLNYLNIVIAFLLRALLIQLLEKL